MQKRGEEIDQTLMYWTFGIIILFLVITSLLVFVNSSVKGTTFRKNMLARDVALIVNTLYLSPGDSIINYNLNEPIYSFGIGDFDGKQRVKVSDSSNNFLNSYRYAEDDYSSRINSRLGKTYDINGMVFIKNEEGINIFDISSDLSEEITKKTSLSKLSKIPLVGKLAFKEQAYGSDEKINDAKAKASGLNAAWPVKIDKVVTSCYGSRGGGKRPSERRCEQDHCGIDIRSLNKEGESADVMAISGGRISRINKACGFAAIQHGDDVISEYRHMASVIVDEGDIVSKGEVIGKAGNKCSSNIGDAAVHLDLSILIRSIDGSTKFVYVDPLAVGLFDIKEIGCKKNSNCFENKYDYETCKETM